MMARGDVTFFNEFAESSGDGRIDLDADTFKVALVNSLPTAADAVPTWGAGGTTNLSSDEVSGTGYTAGGVTLAGVSWSQTSGVATFDSTTNPSWTQNGAGPTDIVGAVIYSDTATNKDAVAFVDMTTDGGTTPISLQDGNISITWNASGIFTCTVNPA